MGKAIDIFHKTIDRSLGLIKIYELTTEKVEFNVHNKTDLIRSAVVLSVSGMDAYFTSRFTESLVGYIKKNGATKNLVAVLSDAGLNTEQALEMLTMDRPYRRVRFLVDDYMARQVTQRFDRIDELFKVYGIPELSKNAQGISKKKKLLTNVEVTVKRRHNIAHTGDYNKHDRLIDINPNKTKKQIQNIKLFVDSCEELISKII